METELQKSSSQHLPDHSDEDELNHTLKIAVAGCSHGQMDAIYQQLAQLEQEQNFKTDLLISCGDYECMRNYADLESLACPPKYRNLHNFHRYYSGQLQAPVLTIFIGGNHEATAYLAELPYGGWVAPNIYYMGFASVINFNGLRIAGLSGIYKGYHFNKGHYEVTPYTQDSMRSAYHVRSLEIFRLRQLMEKEENKKPIDICFSHDWPTGVHRHGDEEWLLSVKPHFQDDISRNSLGNPYAEKLLNELQPRYWFSAHLHVRYKALIKHENGRDTKFLSLDKPLPKRKFLEVIDIDVPIADLHSDGLRYDEAWLAILRNTDHLWHLKASDNYMPTAIVGTSSERIDFKPSQEEIDTVRRLFNNDLKIPHNFQMTAPPHQAGECAKMFRNHQSLNYRNPQSTQFATKLGVLDVNRSFCELSPEDYVGTPYYLQQPNSATQAETISHKAAESFRDPNAIDLDDEGDDENQYMYNLEKHFVKEGTSKRQATEMDSLKANLEEENLNQSNERESEIDKALLSNWGQLDDFKPPPIKKSNVTESSDDVSDNDCKMKEKVIVGALAKMKRRNALEYERKESDDD